MQGVGCLHLAVGPGDLHGHQLRALCRRKEGQGRRLRHDARRGDLRRTLSVVGPPARPSRWSGCQDMTYTFHTSEDALPSRKSQIANQKRLSSDTNSHRGFGCTNSTTQDSGMGSTAHDAVAERKAKFGASLASCSGSRLSVWPRSSAPPVSTSSLQWDCRSGDSTIAFWALLHH